MTKIRTVKPELFRHEALFEAEQYYHLPLRLAFIGLFSCCDREGRFRWEPRSLKLDILPYDEISFADVLNALWEAGFIKKYAWQNKYYGHIPSWHQHQAINKHEPASRLPNPEKCVYEIGTAEIKTTMHMPPSAMLAEVTNLHMHARALHEAVSALKDLEKYVGKSSTEAQNSLLHSQVCAKQIPTSAILESVSKFSPSDENLTTIDKNQSDRINIQNPASPAPALVFGASPLALTTQNQSLHPAESEMHMHARALHEDASAAHGHASLEMEMEREMEVEREREMEGKVEIKNLGANPNIVAQARRSSIKAADILTIFNHWKTTLQHPHAVFDKKRQRLIQQALQQGYTVEQLCDAISGCAQTPHNLGENEQGQRYDGLHIILRDADQIERFIRNCHNPPRPSSNPADQLLRANVTVGENWLKCKKH